MKKQEITWSVELSESAIPCRHFDEPKTEGDVTSPDNLFRFQSEVIRELAAAESCVIVSRCADYILETAGKEDLVKIFVYADIPTCVRRTQGN